MRRQRRTLNIMDNDDDCYDGSQINMNGVNEETMDLLQMERVGQNRTHRFENTIEAKVEEGDTLQALALKFHCTVAEIKRLNKIDKDNEIHARKVIKIPVTIHSVLLGTVPNEQKSSRNSPNTKTPNSQDENVANKNIMRNPLEYDPVVFNEKLMVASVNGSGEGNLKSSTNVNNVILNSKLTPGTNVYADEDPIIAHADDLLDQPLLSDPTAPRLHRIPGPSLSEFDWSGSDCDMSWICLFVVILALCFAIPLIYIIYLAEHPHKHGH